MSASKEVWQKRSYDLELDGLREVKVEASVQCFLLVLCAAEARERDQLGRGEARVRAKGAGHFIASHVR